ncbi:MAG: molecular chaperone TorD family protein [Rhodocyclaceae bacterium]|nr:molecular chaperone TorD family protein [Rhodocyclaceae bacterium]
MSTLQETPVPMARPHDGFDVFRADTYALLGSLLAAPPEQRLLDWLAELETDSEGGSRLAEAWDTLREAASEAIAGQVLDEFNNLFIGLGKGEIVPYASWYKTGYLMEQPLVELRQDLRGLGLEADESTHEPEDHLAALCQVMSLLVRPEEGYSAAQQSHFYMRHMHDWCGRFFKDLQHCPSARFYRAVGVFGVTFSGTESLRFEA